MSPRTKAWAVISCVTAGIVVLLSASVARAADPVKVGPELLVSDGPDDDYVYTPRIAADPAGNFVVAWQDTYDYSEIRARAYWSTGNPRGPKFVMSEPHLYVSTGNFDSDELLSLAADGAGNFIVAYNAETYYGYGPEPACDDKACIVTKRYESDGELSNAFFIVGDPRLFPYDESYNQTANPELAADGEGNFVVAWEGYDYIPGYGIEDEGVWARKLVGVGQVNGSQFRVNEETNGYQGDEGELDIAAADNGDFVVVWYDGNYLGPTYDGIVFQRFDKNKNRLGPQTQAEPTGGVSDPHVAQLPDGTFMIVWNGSGIEGRVFDPSGVPVGPAFEVSPSGGYPEIAASRAGSFIVVFESAGSSSSGRTFDSTGTATSTVFPLNTASDAYTPAVAAADDGNFVATWNAGDGYAYAQRFQVAVPTTEEIPVVGKVVVLTNKDPDNFEKSGGKWKASGDEIVSPLRGSSSDPRCNGDPDGTVKATVRFLSTASGEDHTFDLPCQNWKATGGNKVNSVPKRGYKYSDGKREDGPCNSVKITGTKSLSVSCKGKPGAASFTYDLQSGVSQGPVTTVLQLGLFEYCAEFQPFFDGSDGKKYKGKALAAPGACP